MFSITILMTTNEQTERLLRFPNDLIGYNDSISRLVFIIEMIKYRIHQQLIYEY